MNNKNRDGSRAKESDDFPFVNLTHVDITHTQR